MRKCLVTKYKTLTIFYIRLLPMNAKNETSVRVNMMHDPQKHRGLCLRKKCEVSSVPINCAVKYHMVVYPTIKLGCTVN